ncbi:unnamed protein product [Paramecium primaurelia]|uniref:Uncharacterized protein n=1 Tax=Paramecium primaurelia TaxID=5886 RepID=A0A8S1Q217_PARPR|nr:unnamed protein product [Paramecium primaurelia]
MGQSQLGPYNSDKSFSIIRFYQDKQCSLSEDINQIFLNNAINFSHWHFMIHQSLIINGYFFSNCKLTFNSSLNHNYSRIILQKENKILTFQHEFERVSNDFRFKQKSNTTNTIIEEVNLIELYKQLNIQQQDNMQILDSFGTANTTIQPSIRGRQSNQTKKLFQQSSDEEDFTDFEDKSDSYSPIPSRIHENQQTQIQKIHFPSDSDSGQEIHKPYYTQKQSNYQESPLSITNRIKMEEDQQEQELVYQINSELRNLKNKIEKNIGPSYKNLDVSEEYTTNYQKLIEKQRNQKAISTQGNSQQLLQHCGDKYQSNSSTILNYKIEHPKQNQFNQQITKDKEYQKPPDQQIKYISVKINSNTKLPSNSQKQKTPNTRQPQVPFSSQQILKSPRDPKQASILTHTTGSESECNLNTFKQKNPQPQPINIKIDLKGMSKKIG